MESQTRTSNNSDTTKASRSDSETSGSKFCGEIECQVDCKTFSDWNELKAHLTQVYDLEDVVIQLRPDYVHAENIDSLDRIEVRELSENEVLLSMAVGLRASLDVHLFRMPQKDGESLNWQPRSQYRSILMCAKGVLSRAVRDRVVELMSDRGRSEVVSFFLDGEGRVESASNTAHDFCEKRFPASKRVDDYFPQSHWDYLQGAIRRREAMTNLSYRNESMVFCFSQETGIVDCLLQKMGENGYLLSLSMNR